jgi:hypothetical protein
MTKGIFVVGAVAVPAGAITTDRGAMLIEGEEALTALCPIQSGCPVHGGGESEE